MQHGGKFIDLKNFFMMCYIFDDELLRVMAKVSENEGGGGSHWGPVTHFFEKRKIWPFLKRKCLFLDYKMYSILDRYVRQRLLVIWKRKIGHES